MAELIGRSAKVSGKVQGVFYRASTQQEAKKLMLGGSVKNMVNGQVYIEVFGEADKVEKLLSWCQSGPPMASVSGIQIEVITYKPSTSFEIEY